MRSKAGTTPKGHKTPDVINVVSPGDRGPTLSIADRDQPAAGGMLWLLWNRFVGSYCALTAASRWYVASG